VVDRLFAIMTRLCDGGGALSLISRRMEEVFAITDRLAILRGRRSRIFAPTCH